MTGYQLALVDASGSWLLDLLENSDADYRIDTLGQDATFGNPVPVTEVISSLMTDGGMTTVRSFGNRSAAFSVTISGADAAVMAAGESALMSALDRVAALEWRPPYGVSSYFDVVACWSEFQFDDLAEVQQLKRTFLLTFECLPFARSEDTESFTWTGPGVELDPLSSLTGWTTVSGTAPTVISNPDGAGSAFSLTGTVTFESPAALLDDYLWIKANDATFGGVSIGGTTIPTSSWHNQLVSGRRFYVIPTSDWRGQTLPVRFVSMTGQLYEFYSTSYPSPVVISSTLKPRGIGVVDVIGSARTACTISFTAPAGGAFVYTAPDPNAAIRERGAGEVVFGHFEVTDADGAEVSVGSQIMWYPPGTHSAQIGVTVPQLVELSPDSVWPTQASGAASWDGGTTGIAAGAFQFAYPSDAKAAVSFYDTSGAKNLISPSPSLPEGYHGGAVHHEVHALHPGRCGFAVLDANGNPVSATVTYYPRWRHHAAQ